MKCSDNDISKYVTKGRIGKVVESMRPRPFATKVFSPGYDVCPTTINIYIYIYIFMLQPRCSMLLDISPPGFHGKESIQLLVVTILQERRECKAVDYHMFTNNWQQTR